MGTRIWGLGLDLGTRIWGPGFRDWAMSVPLAKRAVLHEQSKELRPLFLVSPWDIDLT